MGVHRAADIERRFASYIEGLVSVIGHRDRAGPLRDYRVGSAMPGARKSVEPMAALTAPERTAAQHQSLLHFVGQGPWSDEKVLAKVRELVMPRIERAAPIEAWIIDDTELPQAGTAFSWGSTSILRPAWQAGELPGGGIAVYCQQAC